MKPTRRNLLTVIFWAHALTLLTGLSYTAPARAADFIVAPDCTISWPPNAPAEGVIDYRVYINDADPIITETLAVACPPLEPGIEHTVRVTARNAYGESDPAGPVSFFIVEGPPNAPREILISNIEPTD